MALRSAIVIVIDIDIVFCCTLLVCVAAAPSGTLRPQTASDGANRQTSELDVYPAVISYADSRSLIEDILGDTAQFREQPRITEPVRRVRQIEGNAVFFWCRVTGNPTPTVDWFKNERRLDTWRDTLTRRIRTLKHPNGGSVLYIERAHRNDSALYSCWVRADTESAPLNSSASLEVVAQQRAPPANSYPHFVLEPADSTRTQYDRDARIELTCRVNATDSHTVYWFKDNLTLYDLQPSGRSSKRYKEGEEKLIIAQAVESDSGSYQCVALTDRGWMAVSRPSRIDVKPRTSAPSFFVPPTDLEVSSGSDLNLTCIALGNPVPKVQWYNRNLIVSLEQAATDRLAIGSPSNDDTSARANAGIISSGRAIAMMKNLVATDNYTCVAESRYGTINRTITVKVRERPKTASNFTLLQYTATSATFGWRVPPTPNVESQPYAYTIEWKDEQNSSAHAETANFSGPPVTMNQLRPFTAYQFRLFTVGDIARSTPTEYLLFTTQEAPPRTPPREVRARVSNTSNSTIDVSWLEPEEANGVLIGYTVLYVLADDFRPNAKAAGRVRMPVGNWSAVEVNATLKRTKLQHLLVDRTYKIVVNARTQAGHGPLCEPIYVTTNLRVPLQPTGLQALATGNSAFQLLWNAPPQNNVDIMAYVVYYNDTAEASERVEYRADAPHQKVVSQRLTNLKPGTEYTVRVSAKGSDGEGPLSDAVSAQTEEYIPSSPSGLLVTALNSSSIQVSWSSPADSQRYGVIKEYMVTYLATTPRSPVVKFHVPANARENEPESPPAYYELVVNSLAPYTMYEVAVQAVTRRGDGTPARIKVRTHAAVPDPPRSLTMSDVALNDGEAGTHDCLVRATWTPPASTSSTPLLGYRLSYVQRDSDSANASIVINTQRSVELNTTFAELVLYCAQWYEFASFARTRHGESNPARRVFRVPERAPSGLPEAAAFSAVSNSSALLTWLKPAPPLRGGLIVSYALRCVSDSHAFEHREDTNRTAALLSGLQRNAQYYCQLQAATRIGSGPPMNLSFVFSGEQPKAPYNVGTLRLNATSMRVSWMIPPQSISWITIHYVEASRSGVDFASWHKMRIPVATVYDIDKLNAADAYLVRLTAIASDGYESDPSSEYTVPAHSDNAEARGSPEALDLLSTLAVEQVDASSITLNWTLQNALAVRVRDVIRSFRIDYTCFRWYFDERGANRTMPLQRLTKEVPSDQTRTTLMALTPACAYRLALQPVVMTQFASRYNFATRHETACTLTSTPPPPGTPERRSDPVSITFYLPAASGEYGPISYYFIVAVPEILTRSRGPEKFSNEELQYYLVHNSSDGVRVGEIARLPAEEPISRVLGSQLVESETYRLFTRAFIDSRLPSLSIECARQWPAASSSSSHRMAYSSSKYSPPFVYSHAPAALDMAASAEGQSLDQIVVIVGPIAGSFAVILLVVIVVSVLKSRRTQSGTRTRLGAYDQPKQLDKAYMGTNGTGNGVLFGGSKIVEMQDVAMRQPLLGAACVQPDVNCNTLITASSFTNATNGVLLNGNGHFGNGAESPFAVHNGVSPYASYNGNGNGAFSPSATMQRPASRQICQPDGNANAIRAVPSGSSAATSDQNSGNMHINSPASSGRLPVPVEQFRVHVERLKANENALFAQEYESIDPGSHFTWEHSNAESNRQKNRYANVVAYDHSRVVLSQLSEPESDYINANFLDGYRDQNAYMATQGPLPHTTADFWRMCWEHRSAIVVMMTKLEERSRTKCDQYWPNRGTETFGEVIHVTLNDTQEFAYFVVRSLTIQLVGQAEKREIKHLQFTAWPDHGVPEHPAPLLTFIKRVRSFYVSDMGPVIVHCSAGVGRTGAFIVIDSQLERMKQEGSIDVFGQVTQLRSQRNYVVQTEDQYVFIHDALLDAIDFGICGGSVSVTEVPARSLFSYVQKLRVANVVGDNGVLVSGLESQFRKLQLMRPDTVQCATASLPVNRFKNRLVNILPFESTRVQLTPLRGVDGSDYINASYIDGYRQRRMYIATQGCLPETVDDFWRLLWEKRSTIIVMLTRLRELGREKSAQYWPVDRSARFQHLLVEPTAEYDMPSYTLREFKVTDARDGSSRTVRQFAFAEWPEQGVPKSGETFIEFIGQVHKTKEQFGQDGPITVHCGTGSGRTGVFIALSMILERLRYEGLVDVFQTVRMLRLQRTAMVQTEEQYQFVYSTVIEYLGSFDHYAT